MRITATFNAGALIRKDIRHFLERQKFNGHNFDFIEQKSFLSSVFQLKGEERLVHRLVESIRAVYED